jgi:hypothetical protein
METIMIKQTPTLEGRIAVSLQPDAAVTSADIAALIEEVEAIIAKAERDWALDHSQATMDAMLAANGLGPSLPQLQARYQEVYDEEQAAAWWAKREAEWQARHDALKPERDALAEEWREVYPNAARKIADLFVRTAANNEALAKLHRDRPRGMEQHLLSAELHARALDGLSYNTPSLLDSVRLFDWDTGRQICPPERPSMAAAFAAIAMPDRRFSADWAKENERRAPGQRAEQQRHADYLARMSKEQEERQNREARESFMEQQERLTVNRPLKR